MVIAQLTFIPLKLILGDSISTGIKELLQSIDLSTQYISEGFHFSQLLTQTVALLQHRRWGMESKLTKSKLGFPGGSEGKASACSAGDLG